MCRSIESMRLALRQYLHTSSEPRAFPILHYLTSLLLTSRYLMSSNRPSLLFKEYLQLFHFPILPLSVENDWSIWKMFAAACNERLHAQQINCVIVSPKIGHRCHNEEESSSPSKRPLGLTLAFSLTAETLAHVFSICK